MSGAFKDSFTKEDTKEDVLGYDDTAFYYFVVSVLTCVALPWTIAFIDSFVRRGHDADSEYPRKSTEGSTLRYCKTAAMVEKVDKSRSDARKFTPTAAVSSLVQFIVLSIMWACIFGTMTQLGHEKEIQKFDPFVILDVPPSASGSAIKRAYRKFSLIYHPDKNPDDPLAASRFIQITKAYQALTDDIAKRNWEKYGNPDGPQDDEGWHWPTPIPPREGEPFDDFVQFLLRDRFLGAHHIHLLLSECQKLCCEWRRLAFDL